ncbi:MAG TPA: peptidoglycan recognition family protein [Nocardioides sp.]|nr:peptidoglycan recognition family protein [Nocardioides sp.]
MVTLIGRDGWGARPPRSAADTASWSERTTFTVHHSAGPTTQSVRVIQDFHMDTRGWSDIGYNFLVDQGGRAYVGRGWTAVGAHAANNNTAAIGVCVIGNNVITAAAKTAVRWLYDEACRRKGAALAIRGHRQMPGAATSCPGDTIAAWLAAGMKVDDVTEAEIIAALNKWAGSTAGREAIVKAVWQTDNVIAAPAEYVADGNTHWWAESYLNKIMEIRQVRAELEALAGAVEQLDLTLTPEQAAAVTDAARAGAAEAVAAVLERLASAGVALAGDQAPA